MAWGTVFGLLILAFRPAAGSLDTSVEAMAGTSAPCSADGDGTMSVGNSGEPALLHRKDQTGDQVSPLLCRTETATTKGAVVDRRPCGRPTLTASRDTAKRNSPLRL